MQTIVAYAPKSDSRRSKQEDMDEEILVSKLDAARRQLEMAVRMYFVKADPVATHTLTCAAHEILTSLHIKRGGTPPTMHRDNPYVRDDPEIRKEFHHLITEARNFFKHANRAAEKTLSFHPRWTDCYLLDACQLYQRLTGERNSLCKLFLRWMGIQHPDLFVLDEAGKRANEAIRRDPLA